MNELMLDIMSKYGYLGIFFLIFIENLFPPLPSEVILLFGGFLTTYAGLNVPFVILAATLGSLLGAIVLYTLGNKLKYDTIVGLFSGKTGKVLGLKGTDLHKTNEWFRKRGPAAVFLCRFVPLIRSLISIPAGITGMRKRTFLILTALGSAIWNTVLIMLGRIAGESWNKYDSFFSTYSKVFVIIAGVAGLIFIIYRKASAKKNASNINSTGEEN